MSMLLHQWFTENVSCTFPELSETSIWEPTNTNKLEKVLVKNINQRNHNYILSN